MQTNYNKSKMAAFFTYVFRLLDDYRQQKRQGIKNPTFHRHQIPELETDLDCWE